MSVKIIYRPVKKNDTKGYLKVRVIENRKTSIKTLGIKVSGKNWLEDKQRVSKSEPNADKINEKIQDVLRNLNKHDTPTQALKTTNKTILTFYDEIIETTLNNGTKLKYIDIRNRFEAYLNENGYNDLKLSQLTPQHVNAFHTYIRTSGSANNTANYNIKSFKAIINKAIKSGLVSYVNDPFSLLKLKYTPTQNRTLTDKEVSKLIDASFKDDRKKMKSNLGVSYEEFRDIFLFQLFTQGLRCSDVQLLRWNDIKNIDGVLIMDYTQYKTKKKMRLRLTLVALKMLNRRLSKLNETFSDKLLGLELKRERLKDVLHNQKENINKVNNEIELRKVQDAWNKVKGVNSKDEFKQFQKVFWERAGGLTIDYAKTQIKETEKEIYKLYADTIDGIEKPNSFVFHFLNDDDFTNYKDGANLTELQYKRLTGTRAYYNIILKKIAKQCGIKINLTSHVARHTYTQLLLNNNADLVAVSQSLGHSHISTTQTYIQQLPNNSLLDLNDTLNDTFN